MAIQQYIPVTTIQLIGDGNSTSVTMDIGAFLRNLPEWTPAAFNVSAGSVNPVSTSSLSGDMLTVTFTTAPAVATPISLSIYLLL